MMAAILVAQVPIIVGTIVVAAVVLAIMDVGTYTPIVEFVCMMVEIDILKSPTPTRQY